MPPDDGSPPDRRQENAISVLQRYLRMRLLIFNPTAAAANQCACTGELQCVDASQGPMRYVVLRHTHRTNKVREAVAS